jgi:3-oxoacyl-[acyl-carrier-protein] synthase-3
VNTTLGIEAIGTYLPENQITNLDRMEAFAMTEQTVREKVGFLALAQKDPELETSDLCVRAWQSLRQKRPIQTEEVDCLVVCTQNPDGFGLPHTSAIVHRKLGLPQGCAAFDVSLGCSGFVYSLSIIQAFMQANGMRTGILMTADPYSKVIDLQDKKTSTLFGDGATATLISDRPVWTTGAFEFGSDGTKWDSIIVRDQTLHMNGRAVFTFSVRMIPDSIRAMLQKNERSLGDLDRLILHQGSLHIINSIADELGVPREKAPFYAESYGNTVSSSIPMALAQELENEDLRTLLVAGFGVGLSWASTLLFRQP